MSIRRIQLLRCIAAATLLVGLGYIPTRLAIAQQQAPHPELILVLGGGPDREVHAAQLARANPALTVWVSSGSAHTTEIFTAAGVPLSQLHIDRRATDTVTNFTTVVNDLKRKGIQHVYVLTSDYHIPRATAIATVVFGSHGIAFTPVEVTGAHRKESKLRVLRDVGRSFAWLMVGRTGARYRDQPLFRRP